MRILTRVLGVVGLLLAIGLGVVWWRIDSIAETAIERGGSAALGVPTRVGLVLLRPFAGALAVTSLQIDNPPDYEGAFLEVGSTRVAVDLGSLREPTVVVREVAIEDVDLLLEQRLRASNFGTILEHVKGPGASEPPPSEPGGPSKQVVVQDLVIRDVTARVRLVAAPGVPGAGREVTVEIPELRLQDVGSQTQGGAAIGEVVATVVRALLQAVATRSPDLPGELASQLRTSLQGLAQVPFQIQGDVVSTTRDLAEGAVGEAKKALEQPTEALEKSGQAAREATESLKGSGQQAAEKAGEAVRGIGGLLGGEEEESGSGEDDPR